MLTTTFSSFHTYGDGLQDGFIPHLLNVWDEAKRPTLPWILNPEDRSRQHLLYSSSQETLLGICQGWGTGVCVQVVKELPNLINLHREQIFLSSDFSSDSRALGFLKSGLSNKTEIKEGINHLSLFHVLCLHVFHLSPWFFSCCLSICRSPSCCPSYTWSGWLPGGLCFPCRHWLYCSWQSRQQRQRAGSPW